MKSHLPCMLRLPQFGAGGCGWYSIYSNGGETVSTEAVAARRHAGLHLPAIEWKQTNWQLTASTRSLNKISLRVSPGVTYALGMRRHTVGWSARFGP